MDIQDVISCYDRKIEQLEKENAKLRKENSKLKEQKSKLKEQKSNSSWQYEMDHKDDWRTVHEMGSL